MLVVAISGVGETQRPFGCKGETSLVQEPHQETTVRIRGWGRSPEAWTASEATCWAPPPFPSLLCCSAL